MHVERNVSANILKHIFGDKDTPATRIDMEHAEKVSAPLAPASSKFLELFETPCTLCIQGFREARVHGHGF